MKKIIISLLKYLNKKFEIAVINEFVRYDIIDIWFYKEKIVIRINNKRELNMEE